MKLWVNSSLLPSTKAIFDLWPQILNILNLTTFIPHTLIQSK